MNPFGFFGQTCLIGVKEIKIFVCQNKISQVLCSLNSINHFPFSCFDVQVFAFARKMKKNWNLFGSAPPRKSRVIGYLVCHVYVFPVVTETKPSYYHEVAQG